MGRPSPAGHNYGGQAYGHNGDWELMRSLGLKTNFNSDWTNVGTVVVEEAEPDGAYGSKPAAKVKVEVAALPAQFCRFTITRPRSTNHRWVKCRDCGGRGRGCSECVGGKRLRVTYKTERVVMATGSGGFGEYWPMAEAIARNMVTIKPSKPRAKAAR